MMLAHRPILSHVTPGLTHKPDGSCVNRFAAAGADKPGVGSRHQLKTLTKICHGDTETQRGRATTKTQYSPRRRGDTEKVREKPSQSKYKIKTPRTTEPQPKPNIHHGDTEARRHGEK